MVAIGAIPANLLWLRMARFARAKGLEFPTWNFGIPGMLTGLRSFRQLLHTEGDPDKKTSNKLLRAALFVALAWCLFWLAAIVLARR